MNLIKREHSPSCGAVVRVKPKARLWEGIYIVDSPQRKPEGLQESSRWSESAETTGRVVSHDRTPEGCQTSQWILLVKFDTGRVETFSQFMNKGMFTMMRILCGNVAPY